MRWSALLVVALVVLWSQGRFSSPPSTGEAASANPAAADATVEEWFETRRSGQMVTVEGIISRTLEDDKEGSRHQRFIVRLQSGRTLLVAHNIDLAPRVPLAQGDAVRVRGEYEWNERGGLLHWTHHDPDGDHPGGWIDFDGVRYE